MLELDAVLHNTFVNETAQYCQRGCPILPMRLPNIDNETAQYCQWDCPILPTRLPNIANETANIANETAQYCQQDCQILPMRLPTIYECVLFHRDIVLNFSQSFSFYFLHITNIYFLPKELWTFFNIYKLFELQTDYQILKNSNISILSQISPKSMHNLEWLELSYCFTSSLKWTRVATF